MLLLQVMTIKTDRKAKFYFKCRMKVDTSVIDICRDTQQPSLLFLTRGILSE